MADSEAKLARIFNIYTYCTLVYFVVLGGIAILTANSAVDGTIGVSPINQQVIPDWQQIPYTDLTVV